MEVSYVIDKNIYNIFSQFLKWIEEDQQEEVEQEPLEETPKIPQVLINLTEPTKVDIFLGSLSIYSY